MMGLFTGIPSWGSSKTPGCFMLHKLVKGAESRGILPFMNKTKLQYLHLFTKQYYNIKRKKSTIIFERRTIYGPF